MKKADTLACPPKTENPKPKTVSFKSATRTIFSCNPRKPKQATYQKKMEDFRHGCHAVEGLFPDKMPLIIRHTIHFISAIFPAPLIRIFCGKISAILSHLFT